MPTLELVIDARRARAGAALFQKAATSVQGAAGRATVAAGRVSKSFKGMQGAARGLVGPLGGIATAFLGIAGVTKAVKTIVDFEQTMATLKGVTGATADQLDRLSSTAREFGATTEFSATQAGEGLLFLSRAGFTADEAMTALPDTLNLATAGMIDLGEAADISSNILQAFGLEVTEMERVADTLVNTANKSNTDIRQLAEAMKFAAPIAGQLGISIEETSAAIGALGDVGIQGGMAGTNLRQIMNQLIKPTRQAQEAIKAMGLTVEELSPASNTLTEIFKRLSAANLTVADATTIFASRNAAAALSLASAADKVDDLTKANKEAKGAAEENARIMRDTLGGALKGLQSVFEELILTAGDSGMTGALKGIVEVTTDAVRILAGLESKITGNEKAAHRLATVIKLLAVVMALVVAVKIVGGIAALTVGLVNATVAAVGFAASMWPVLAVIAAIAVAAAGFELGRWLGEEFKIVQEVGAATANLLLVSWERINQAFELTPVVMALAWNGMKTLAVETTQFMLSQVNSFLEGIDTAVNSIIRTINKVIIEFAAAAQAAGEEDLAQKILGTRLSGVNFSGITDKVTKGMKIVQDEVRKEGIKLVEEFDTINKSTQDTIDDLDEILGNQLKDIQVEFSGKADADFLEFLKKDLEAITDSIDLSGVGESLAEGLGGAIDSLEGPLNSLLEKLGFTADQISDIDKQLKEIEKKSAPVVTNKTAGLPLPSTPDEVMPALAGAGDATKELTEGMQTLKGITESAASSFVNAFDAMAFGGKNAADAMKDLTKEIIRMVAQTLVLKAVQAGIDAAFSPADEAASATAAAAIATTASSTAAVITTTAATTAAAATIAAATTAAAIMTAANAAGSIGGAIGSANGNVFHGGQIQAFASGGVLNTSTFFPMANGGVGLAGEAGPEAIMPLSRDARGKLGVVAAGGGGGNTNNTTVHINVTTKDAGSFRQSESQISAGIAAGMAGAAARQSRRTA